MKTYSIEKEGQISFEEFKKMMECDEMLEKSVLVV